MDHKLRNAVKILQSEKRAADHEKDVASLREKIIDRVSALAPTVPNAVCPISGTLVQKSLSKIGRGAAAAIDAWSRDLMSAAIAVDPTISEDLGVILTWIMEQGYTTLALDIVRASRLVAINKPDGGSRPITISSFLLKLLGICVLTRASPKLSKFQFAQAGASGGTTVVHRLRRLYNDGLAILKIDSTNAFGVCQRKKIQDAIQHMDGDIKAYFAANYIRSIRLLTRITYAACTGRHQRSSSNVFGKQTGNTT
jgi:hypothetical protein